MSRTVREAVDVRSKRQSTRSVSRRVGYSLGFSRGPATRLNGTTPAPLPPRRPDWSTGRPPGIRCTRASWSCIPDGCDLDV